MPEMKEPPQSQSTTRQPLLTVVVPAYNEAQNLPILYERLVKALHGSAILWELVIVDDHSVDGTFGVVENLAKNDRRVRGYRLSRNFGSHMAIACGLDHARGDCAVVLAADLQDPPEVIPELLAKWREGAQVIWAVRRKREGERVGTIALSRLYYVVMRHLVGLREMPPTGADFFLIDRRVIESLRKFRERHVNILALLLWLGFQQASVFYAKQPRLHGRSGWNLEKKLKLVADSVTSFTYLPLRLISYIGLVTALTGFLYSLVVVINALRGVTVQGWASLMVVVLIIGGVQMIMLGVLGEYLWRALDEARQRPRYVIERCTPTRDRT